MRTSSLKTQPWPQPPHAPSLHEPDPVSDGNTVCLWGERVIFWPEMVALHPAASHWRQQQTMNPQKGAGFSVPPPIHPAHPTLNSQVTWLGDPLAYGAENRNMLRSMRHTLCLIIFVEFDVPEHICLGVGETVAALQNLTTARAHRACSDAFGN